MQACFVQNPEDLLRSGQWCEGGDGLRELHREHPSLLQRLTQGGVIERQSAGQQVDGRGGGVPTPAMACSTLSTKGGTELAARAFPTGTCRAKMKPAAGAAIIPGLRPHWAGQWRLPLPMGAMVGS